MTEPPLNRSQPAAVSVVTAVFNGKKHLRATIESVAKQTVPIYEHILVNDASSDGSGELAEELSKQFPALRVIHNTVNLGFPASLNIGILSCIAPFVAIIDSDDIAFPNWIETVLPALEGDQNVASVGGGCIFMTESGIKTNRCGYCKSAGDVTEAAQRGIYPFLHPGTVHRKEILEKVGGYNQKIKSAEDLDLFLSISHSANLINVGKPLVYYRRRRGSESRKTDEYNKAIADFLDEKRKLLAAGYSVEEANKSLSQLIDSLQGVPRIRKLPAWQYDLEMGEHFEHGGRYFWSAWFRAKVLFSFQQKRSSFRAIARCVFRATFPRTVASK